MMDETISHGNTIRPGYYQSAMGDVFDIADAYRLDMACGMAVKYILRAGKKDKAKEIEDLEKCIECVSRAIEIRKRKAVEEVEQVERPNRKKIREISCDEKSCQ